MSDIAQDLGGVVLLPCPFCGYRMTDEDGGVYQKSGFIGSQTPVWEVCCGTTMCNASVTATSREFAITAWNTRAHSAEIAGALRDAERWQPIESAPDDIGLCVVYTPDQGDGERFDIDWKEDGVWHEHYNHFEHFMAVGGANACGPDVVCTGPGEEPEYTHYRRLTPPQAAMGAVGAGDHASDCRSHDDASVCDCGLLQHR